jgi:hypothetical protein
MPAIICVYGQARTGNFSWSTFLLPGIDNTVLLRARALATFLLDCRRAAAIQQRVTAVLRSIPKDAFAHSFHKFYERCQPCVVKDGDYFEGQ